MNITINKASLKDEIFLKGDYDQKIGEASRNIKFDDEHPVHDDLRRVFHDLSEHLRLLCQQPGEKIYKCTGFTISGSGDSEGVVLIGQRTLSNGKILNLVSPFQKWDDAEPYEGTQELSELIETAKNEVYAYLFEGKHAPNNQLSLFDDQEEEETRTEQERMDDEDPVTVEMAETAKKRKPRKSKNA